MNKGKILILLLLALTPFLIAQEESSGGGGCKGSGTSSEGDGGGGHGGADPAGMPGGGGNGGNGDGGNDTGVMADRCGAGVAEKDCPPDSGFDVCFDCLDNDGNGLVDCDDVSCAPFCQSSVCFTNCGEGDTCFTFCLTLGFGSLDEQLTICHSETNCTNEIDDNGDGSTDCFDPDCCIHQECADAPSCGG